MSHNRHNYRSAGGNIATSGECSGVNKKIIACIKQGQRIQQRGCNKPFHLCSPVVPKGCQRHPDSVPAMVAYLKNRFHSMARKKLVSLFLTGGITSTRKLGAHSESRAKHTLPPLAKSQGSARRSPGWGGGDGYQVTVSRGGGGLQGYLRANCGTLH